MFILLQKPVLGVYILVPKVSFYAVLVPRSETPLNAQGILVISDTGGKGNEFESNSGLNNMFWMMTSPSSVIQKALNLFEIKD